MTKRDRMIQTEKLFLRALNVTYNNNTSKVNKIWHSETFNDTYTSKMSGENVYQYIDNQVGLLMDCFYKGDIEEEKFHIKLDAYLSIQNELFILWMDTEEEA